MSHNSQVIEIIIMIIIMIMIIWIGIS